MAQTSCDVLGNFDMTMPGAMDQNSFNLFEDIDLDDLFGSASGTDNALQQPKQTLDRPASLDKAPVWRSDNTHFGTPVDPMRAQLLQDIILQAPYGSTAQGPRFHPEVGWYFPVTLPSLGSQWLGMQPQGLPPQDFQATFAPQPNGGMGHATQPAPMLDPNESSEMQVDVKKQPKRKASKQPANAPRKTRKAAADKRFIVSDCVCGQPGPRIPRPKNAFILYRSYNAKRLLEHHGNNNRTVSAIAGEMWHKEPEDVKAKFRMLAGKEKKRHAKLYPNYTFRPGWKSRFGDEACTCGAFQINTKAMEDQKASSISEISSTDIDSIDFDSSDFFADDEDDGDNEIRVSQSKHE